MRARCLGSSARRSAAHGRSGAALPAALVALVVSASLAAAVAEMTRTQLLITRHRRAAATALTAADACLATIVTSLPLGWDFDEILAGPDGVPGSGDDGTLAPPPACAVHALAAPGASDPPRLTLSVTGAAGGGRRAIEGLAGRSPFPGVPTMLWLAELPAPGSVTGVLLLDGEGPGAPGWAAMAAPAEALALDAWMAAEAPAVVAAPGTLAPLTAPPPPLPALALRLAATAPAGAEALLVPPAVPVPGLAAIAGDLVVSDVRRGAGLLLVQGDLDIRGGLEFTGVVAASGGVRVASGASLVVSGALWVGPAVVPGSSLLVDGDVTLIANRPAIDDADRLLPLPRRAILLGVRDVG